MVGLFLRHYVIWIHSCGVKCTSKRVFCQNVWMICIIQYIIQYKCTIWNSLIIHIQFTMEMNFVSKWSTVICNVFLSSNKPTKIWWRFLSTVVFQFCSIQYFVIFFIKNSPNANTDFTSSHVWKFTAIFQSNSAIFHF